MQIKSDGDLEKCISRKGSEYLDSGGDFQVEPKEFLVDERLSMREKG